MTAGPLRAPLNCREQGRLSDVTHSFAQDKFSTAFPTVGPTSFRSFQYLLVTGAESTNSSLLALVLQIILCSHTLNSEKEDSEQSIQP